MAKKQPAGPPAPSVTHYVPYNTARYHHGRQGTAECGRIVDMTTHSTDPTCPDCAQLRVDYDRSATEAI